MIRALAPNWMVWLPCVHEKSSTKLCTGTSTLLDRENEIGDEKPDRVTSGCAEIPAEKPVDFRDRAPADERDRPARSVAYRREQMPEIVVDPHEVRAFGDVQKRPVDVQEESRVCGQARHGSEREPDVRDSPVLERLSSRSRGGHVATPAAGFRHRHP